VPSSSTRESLSQGVKLLKLAKLKELIDVHDMQLCMIFCRTNFDVDNLEQYLTSLGGGKACASSAGLKSAWAAVVVGEAHVTLTLRLGLALTLTLTVTLPHPDPAVRGKTESGKENPYSCVVLAGGRSMDERRRALAAFKEGDVRFMLCTDVAARGLDVKELPFVINMTLPDRSEDYIHRVGRVGRADIMGLAISIVAETELEKVRVCRVS